MPGGFVRFGPGLLPREASDASGSSPGHVVATATVTVCVGLAIAVGRRLAAVVRVRTGRTHPDGPAGGAPGSAAGAPGVARWVPLLAGLLPLGALALAVYDHAGWNAAAYSGDRWLDAATTTAPLALRLFWSLTGHGEGRTALLVVLVVAAAAVDAARYARAHRLAARATQAGGPGGDVVEVLGLGPPAPTTSSNPVAAAVVALGRQLVLDLRFAAAARVKQPGEGRLVAVARGRVAAQMCRTQRELLVELARGDRSTTSYRVGGLVALAVLAVGAFVLGPLLAAQIGPSLDGTGLWLAGQLESIGEWFSGLSFGQQVAVGIGIAALVALSGGSLGLALGVSGVATYLLAHGQGAGAFVRDPRGATRSYLATRSPFEMAVDAGEAVLTFLPGNVGGAVVARYGRAGIDEFTARGGTAWRAQWRARHGDAGEADRGPFSFDNPARWDDPATRQQWVDERLTDPRVGDNGMRRPGRGEPDDLAFQVAHAGPDEVLLMTPTSSPIWADGLGVYGDDVVVTAVETKWVRNPGGSAINEGTAPDFIMKNALKGLDREFVRYAEVLRHPGNPVTRLRIVASTPDAAEFLLARAKAVMGDGMVVTVEPASAGPVAVVVRVRG